MIKAEELKSIGEALIGNGDPSYITLCDPQGRLSVQGRLVAAWVHDNLNTGTAPQTAAFGRYAAQCERGHMRPGDFFRAFPQDARALYVAMLEESIAACDELLAGKKPNPALPIDTDKIWRRVEARLNDDGNRPPLNMAELRG